MIERATLEGGPILLCGRQCPAGGGVGAEVRDRVLKLSGQRRCLPLTLTEQVGNDAGTLDDRVVSQVGRERQDRADHVVGRVELAQPLGWPEPRRDAADVPG
jgi:hypothetical protein